MPVAATLTATGQQVPWRRTAAGAGQPYERCDLAVTTDSGRPQVWQARSSMRSQPVGRGWRFCLHAQDGTFPISRSGAVNKDSRSVDEATSWRTVAKRRRNGSWRSGRRDGAAATLRTRTISATASSVASKCSIGPRVDRIELSSARDRPHVRGDDRRRLAGRRRVPGERWAGRCRFHRRHAAFARPREDARVFASSHKSVSGSQPSSGPKGSVKSAAM